jgi:hypothetical protein
MRSVRGQVHAHIAVPDSSTHFLCPDGPTARGALDSTHHLVPRRSGIEQVLTCRYCNKTDAELRKIHGLD